VDPSPVTRRQSPEARRATLLAIATQTIRQDGSAVGMEQIAAAASTSKTAIYRVFGSKRGLYQAVADQFIAGVLDDIDTLIRRPGSLEAFVAGIVEAVVARIEADAALYQFLMRRARLELSSAAATGDGDFLRQFGDQITGRIAVRLERIGLDPSPAPVIAHAVSGMINGVVDWWLDQPDVDRATVVAVLTALLWTGFAPYEREPAHQRGPR
jgi:AcrR family transcriptional regulator